MPIAEVIRLAGHANHYLAVSIGRPDQPWICSAPNGSPPRPSGSCRSAGMVVARNRVAPSGAYGCQVDHVVVDWVDGGQHQRRRARPGLRPRQPLGRTRAVGPRRSTGAAKSNGPHPPIWTPAKPGSTTTTDPNDSSAHPTNQNPTPGEPPPPEPVGDGGCGEPEPFDPAGDDDADQPGGPAPPDDQAA